MINKSDYLVYLNEVKENWIIDRTRKEWYDNNHKYSTSKSRNADIIWLIASWNWKNVNKRKLKNKKVLCSIYHIDESKFDDKAEKEFFDRDKYVDEYHVISKKTMEQVQKLTPKKITSIPFWINPQIWFEIEKKDELYRDMNLDENDFLIGSFQRDSEGKDPSKPKLSKGPDNFVKIVRDLKETNENLHVVLTGRKRDYLISELKKYNIRYSYFEMVDFVSMNKLYNCLDLYIVSSRFEGGPQAILECGITKTPIISTDVGIASEILAPESIFNMENFLEAKPNIDHAYLKTKKFEMENTFKLYNKMLERIYES